MSNKRFFFILFLMCSCSLNKQKQDDVYTLRLKAKADAEEKVNKVIQQLRVDCDSTIFHIARQKADSLEMSRKQTKPAKKKHKGALK